MKIGLRTPSFKKSFKARTTGRIKRAAKKAVIPGYGKKGSGLIKNPKRSVYNKVYNKTTIGVSDMIDNKNSKTTKSSVNKKSKKDIQQFIPNNEYANTNSENLTNNVPSKPLNKKAVYGVGIALLLIMCIADFIGTLTILGAISMLAFPVVLGFALYNFIKKKEYKKHLISAGALFVLFVIGMAITPSSIDDTTNTNSTAETTLVTQQYVEQTIVGTSEVTLLQTTTQDIGTQNFSNSTTQKVTNNYKSNDSQIHNYGINEKTTVSNATAKATTKAVANKTTVQKTTSPKTTVANLASGQVYIPKSGKRYHYNSKCSDGKYTSISKSRAIDLGYTPCKKCAGG